MEFFNKKEEVIETILTEKGKELYSQGKFNPTYYSFHDTDITYDNGTGEEQNNTVTRIRDTPTLKSPTGIVQIDSKINYNDLNNTKKHIISCEIGEKTIGDQYAPAWNIKFVKSPLFQYYGLDREHITDGKKYQLDIKSDLEANSGFQETIPQFNINTVYQYAKINLEPNKDYVIRDPDLLVKISEYNAFNASEFEEYEVEFFAVDSAKELYNKIDNEELKKYITIYFDKLADLQDVSALKNTYDPQTESDESTC